jgi:hypothetical protein
MVQAQKVALNKHAEVSKLTDRQKQAVEKFHRRLAFFRHGRRI